MCGLVGVAGTITRKDEKVFQGLLEVDTARGRHSTGVLNVSRYNKNVPYRIDKAVGTPWDLYDSLDRRPFIIGSPKVLFGHNRAATLGEVNKENAHPFDFDNIVGMHNGTLMSWRKLEDAKEYAVDSQALFNHIDKRGLQDALDNCEGAFALIWYNKEKDEVHMVRNNKRPLHFCFSESLETIYWASEYWMLESQLARFGVKHGTINKLNELVHCRLSIPTHGKQFEKIRTRKVQETITPVKKPINRAGNFFGDEYPFPGGQRTYTPPHQRASVSYLPPSKGSSGHINKLKERANKNVTFRVNSSIYKQEGSYIRCTVIDEPLIEVRVFCGRGSPMWEMLTNNTAGKRFTAHMKRANLNQLYLLADKRTVRETNVASLHEIQTKNKKAVEDDGPTEEKEKDYYPIANDVMVTAGEFLKRTSHGCGFCTIAPDLDDAPDLYWMDNGEHLCVSCQELAEVKEYVNLH